MAAAACETDASASAAMRGIDLGRVAPSGRGVGGLDQEAELTLEAAACRDHRLKRAGVPESTSSWSLVSSRAITSRRAPSTAARSARAASIRAAVSKKISVAATPASSPKTVRRAADLGRQKATEHEAVAGQAGQRHGGKGGAGAGDDRHQAAGAPRLADELPSRIGDERRAGIAHQRDRRPILQVLENAGPHLRRIMVMIGLKGGRDLIPVEELCSDPGVLAKHIVGARQGCKGAQTYVGEVADRGGNDIEARRGRGASKTLAAIWKADGAAGGFAGGDFAGDDGGMTAFVADRMGLD